MRLASNLLGALALLGILAMSAQAADKEVTLKGTILCAKCALKEAKKCQTAIKVKEGGKDVVYFFDKASHGKNHGTICMEPKEGSVTGVKGEADGKKKPPVRADGTAGKARAGQAGLKLVTARREKRRKSA